jgi:hypothetical protein
MEIMNRAFTAKPLYRLVVPKQMISLGLQIAELSRSNIIRHWFRGRVSYFENELQICLR